MVKKERMECDAGEKCTAYDHDEEVLQNVQKTSVKCCFFRRHIRVQGLFPIVFSPYYLSLSRGKCSLIVYEALDCRSSGVSVENGADAAGGFAKRKEIKFR